MSEDNKIVFSHWALRGQGHIPRLVMEYLQIPYHQKNFLTPQSWFKGDNQDSKKACQLPYLTDGDFVVTNVVPILTYILKKSGYPQLLGRTVEDQARVEMFLWSTQNIFRNVISVSTLVKQTTQQYLAAKEHSWQLSICKKLKTIQSCLRPGEWYLGQLTVVDFFIYELIHYLNLLFLSKVASFPKMTDIHRRLGLSPQIRKYARTKEHQSLCFLPLEMCKLYKSQCKGK